MGDICAYPRCRQKPSGVLWYGRLLCERCENRPTHELHAAFRITEPDCACVHCSRGRAVQLEFSTGPP